MVGKPDEQLVWCYLLAHANRDGTVEAHPNIVALKTGLTRERVDHALASHEAEDPDSRSTVENGRRLVRIPSDRGFVWRIVNYEFYRDLRRADDRRTYHREYYRENRSVESQQISTGLNVDSSRSTEVEVEVEGRGEKKKTLARGSISLAAVSDPNRLPEGEISADAVFDRVFWPEYPRKVAKGDARNQWKRLKIGDRDEKLVVAIMAGLRRDIKGEWRERPVDKIPYAATWLFNRRWEG